MKTSLRRRLGAAAVAGVTLCTGLGLGASPASADDYYVPITDRLTLHGHGFGHGRGMSQYGAQGAALKGLTWQQIIGFYYPGTTIGSAGGDIRVRLTTVPDSRDLTVLRASGLLVRDLADGRVWQLPTGPDLWRLHVTNGNDVQVWYHDGGGWHVWTIPGRGTTLRGEGEFQARQPLAVWGNRGTLHYRERLRTVASFGATSLRRSIVNVLSLDKYVQGVVPKEMPASWEPAAVQAQAVAARSYAVRHRNSAGSRWFDVDDTTSYQVYGGVEYEVAAANQAVAATAGKVVLYRGSVALTEFSASSGGYSAGGTSLPYQQVKADPYDGVPPNPYHSWAETVGVSALEDRYPGIGELLRIEVTQRDRGGEWGGRITQAVLHGRRGEVTVTGNTLRSAWGLYSDWFAPDPTPIIQRWIALGGASSYFGQVRTAELAVHRGSMMIFDRGRIYWSARTGAQEIYGAILSRYITNGGPRSALLLPSRPERYAGVPGGRFTTFERGVIYWSRDTGAHAILAGINSAYARVGGPRAIGMPVDEEQSAGVVGGRWSPFQRGDIYWSRDTGAHPVYGAIRGIYRGLGGPAALGLPTTDEHAGPVAGSRMTNFQRSEVYWSRSTGAHSVYGAIRGWYNGHGGAAALGLPTGNEQATAGGDGREQSFTGGIVYWSRATGAHFVAGDMLRAYVEYGGTASALGLATSEARPTQGGERQDFQGGWISIDSATGQATVQLTGG